jgi:AraC-like DNA-binding protein
LSNEGILKSEKLSNFFLSDNDYLYLPNLLESKKNLYENLINSVIQQDLKLSTNLLELKSMTYELMTSFVSTIEEINFTSVSQNVTEKDKRLVLKAQHIIDESILEKFPSIHEISKKIGVSETKLKSDFKLLTGTTMYQYFLSKQMIYANELLKNKEVKIKEVAFLLGYVSHSKFSSTFKKHFGYLPSEVE